MLQFSIASKLSVFAIACYCDLTATLYLVFLTTFTLFFVSICGVIFYWQPIRRK